MEYYICKPDSELYHWGVKGMRWGVRRYQRKDGSLTPAGRKRRAKLEAELDKLGGSKKSDGDGAPQKKSINEMSNKELQEHTTRMQLEKNYYDAQRQLAAMNPKQVSKGQKIAEKLLNEAIVPAATNAGKAYLEKLLKEKAGINTEDPIKALENTWKKLDYEQKIDKIKNPDKYLSEEDKNKRQQREYDAEDRAARMEGKGYQNAADKANKERQAQENARKAEADEAARAANNAKSEEYYNSSYSKTGGERTDTNPNANRGMSVVNDYENVPVSSFSDAAKNSGKSRIDSIIDRDGNEIFSFDYNTFSDYKKDDD